MGRASVPSPLVLRRRKQGGGSPRTDVTRLFRNRAQLGVLSRALLPLVDGDRILVYGVADGAEAVSLLAVLVPDPSTEVRLVGRDVDDALLTAAADGRYLPAHAPDGLPSTAATVLEPAPGGGWRVLPERRRQLHYERGDVLDAGEDAAGDHRLVCCQNTLTLFEPASIGPAVAALAAHVAPGGLLCLGGGPLDLVPGAAVAAGLEPVHDDVEAVHEGWEVQRAFWDNPVRPPWALEPYDAGHPEAPLRYTSVFRRPEA